MHTPNEAKKAVVLRQIQPFKPSVFFCLQKRKRKEKTFFKLSHVHPLPPGTLCEARLPDEEPQQGWRWHPQDIAQWCSHALHTPSAGDPEALHPDTSSGHGWSHGPAQWARHAPWPPEQNHRCHVKSHVQPTWQLGIPSFSFSTKQTNIWDDRYVLKPSSMLVCVCLCVREKLYDGIKQLNCFCLTRRWVKCEPADKWDSSKQMLLL